MLFDILVFIEVIQGKKKFAVIFCSFYQLGIYWSSKLCMLYMDMADRDFCFSNGVRLWWNFNPVISLIS